jgi:hypothetical protein
MSSLEIDVISNLVDLNKIKDIENIKNILETIGIYSLDLENDEDKMYKLKLLAKELSNNKQNNIYNTEDYSLIILLIQYELIIVEQIQSNLK